MTTALEIVDTAVKLGFGAGIAAIATHLLARSKYTHELKKAVFDNRTSTLREIVDEAEESSGLANDFAHASYGVVLPAESTQVRAFTEKLMQSYKRMGKTQSLAHLIGLERLSAIIGEICKLLLRLHQIFATDIENPDLPLAGETIKSINEKMKEFRAELGQSYKEISSSSA